MNKVQYDLIYLAACGVNNVRADRAVLGDVDMEELYRISCTHFLDALVGTTLKHAGITIPQNWNERISKAIRKALLFDTERAKILSFMEQNGIWYLPLKGVILKDYYPSVGMRQMSDNDILFDYSFCDKVRKYMDSLGYETEGTGRGNHDVYKKEPVYNFELHKALYGKLHQDGWGEYYENVKDRLILNEGSSYGYHFTDEDYYVYITSHAYKHYSAGGTGLRTLLDFYVYLKAKPELDFSYIEKECEVLGIRAFEKHSRELCKKVFEGTALNGQEALENSLSEEDKEMLAYYFSSGVYGTMERGVENRVHKYQQKTGRKSKFRYILGRIFPNSKVMECYYPAFGKHKILIPIGWVYRWFCILFDSERTKRAFREISLIKKVK